MPKKVAKKEIDRCNVAVGKVVRERRVQLGMSQETLAMKAGLHRTYISDLERGIRNLTLGALTGICTGLDISLTNFVKLAEQKLG